MSATHYYTLKNKPKEYLVMAAIAGLTSIVLAKTTNADDASFIVEALKAYKDKPQSCQ